MHSVTPSGAGERTWPSTASAPAAQGCHAGPLHPPAAEDGCVTTRRQPQPSCASLPPSCETPHAPGSQTPAAAAPRCHASSPTQQTAAGETSAAADPHARRDARPGSPTAPGSRAAAARHASSPLTDAAAASPSPLPQPQPSTTSATDADPACTRPPVP